jgi:hypothetical protein
MVDIGEASLAYVGLSPLLRKNVPFVGNEAAREIGKTDERITKLAKQLCSGELEQPELAREHNYRKTLDLFAEPVIPHADLVAAGMQFKGEAAEFFGPYSTKAAEAYQKAEQFFPRSEYITYTGPVNMVPDSDAVWKFFLKLQMVDDPLSVLSYIATGTILAPQVMTVRDMYPSITAAIDSAIQQCAVDAKAAKQSYRLPPMAEMGLAKWQGRRVADFSPAPQPKIIPQLNKPSPRVSRALLSPAQETTERGPNNP